MTYGFGEQLRIGEAYENDLDEFFRRWYEVMPVSMELQKLGVDRIFIDQTGRRLSIEYKADETAARTHNAFVETVSVDTEGKPGWALSSIAQLLIYFIPPIRKIYVCRMLDLKMDIEELIAKFPTKQIPNNGYHTTGVPVPLWLIEERYAIRVLMMSRRAAIRELTGALPPPAVVRVGA